MKHKGHQLLIEAMSRMHKEYPRLRLLICGEGSYRDELEELVQKLGVKEKVVMLGWVDTAEVIPAGDVFALVSDVEGFGLVSAEAGMCGLASIRTATTGAADIVVPSVTGHIVPVGDVDAITKALEDFACRPGAWRKMGEQARRYCLEKFDLRTCAAAHVKLYERLLSGRSQD